LSLPLETIKLTASFKLRGLIPESLFSTYSEILNSLAKYASTRRITGFRRLKAEKPSFKKLVIMLDDCLFSLDLEGWEASIATENGRIKLRSLYGTYREKFREARPGQAWLLKREDEFYLKVIFSKIVEIVEPMGKQ